MTPNPETGKDNPEQCSLKDKIKQTAEKRAAYTRKFLIGKGLDLAEFCTNLTKKPFELNVKPEDKKDLALEIYELQKKLGFPERDNAQGCDGKLGLYTYSAYLRSTEHEKSQSGRKGLMNEPQPSAVDEEAAAQTNPTHTPATRDPSEPATPRQKPTSHVPAAPDQSQGVVSPEVSDPSPSNLPEELTTNLQEGIKKITENMQGTVAVNIFDPDTEQYLAQLNGEIITPSASLIKVPILFALHKAVNEGKVKERDVTRLKWCAEKMISVSANEATDEIIDYLGMKFINESIRELGLKDTKLNRLMVGPGSGRNWTTAQDITKALTLAITQNPPTGWPSAMHLMQLNASKAKDGSLAKTLPPDVKIAQKGGQIVGQEHYAATFTLGKKKLVMVSDYSTRGKAKEGIRQIGKLVYDVLKQKT